MVLSESRTRAWRGLWSQSIFVVMNNTLSLWVFCFVNAVVIASSLDVHPRHVQHGAELTDVQAQEQYKNWKTKRRHSTRQLNVKHLTGDDDELFFDSNGMPIQHDEDDDDDIGEIDESAAVNNESTFNGSDAPVGTDKPMQPDQKEAISKLDDLNGGHDKPEHIHNKLFNSTTHHSDDKPADTILDDILRGFSFALLFCICAICLHKLCWYSCVRCGILPDDRVVEARWKRLQLKHKRAYTNVPVAMDPKSLGKWFDQRDKMNPDGMGIWDSSADRSVGSWDEESSGALDFDEGVELSNWDKDDASAAAELEFGEGEELEDKSHDERLFDVEDGGAGLKEQANKFFHGTKKLFSKKTKSEPIQVQATNKSVAAIENLFDTDGDNDVSDDAFFDALQPPSVDAFSDQASESSKSNAQDLQQTHGSQNDVKASMGKYEEELNGDLLLDDRGYDEESDLLGLRSDSPPPLDLAEIEKNMLENMEKAKSYY
jgi:hypothetical protein